MKEHIKIISRRSTLAKIQAKLVGNTIKSKYPKIKIEYSWIKTIGDIDQKLDISSGSSMGLFTSDISKKVISSDNNIAVHSWKDYPILENGYSNIYATINRADMRDILILKDSLKNLKNIRTIKIMTSSPRRRYALNTHLKNLIPLQFKNIKFHDLRGNINTRIEKFLNNDVDGVVVAKAALDRILNSDCNDTIKNNINTCLRKHHWMVLPLSLFPTAPGQGAIGVEVNNKNLEMIDILKTINVIDIFKNVKKEKEIMSKYGGGCSQKIGISIWKKNNITIQSINGKTDANKVLQSFEITERPIKVLENKTTKKENAFPTNKKEQNIFTRINKNKNNQISKIDNAIIYITRKNTLIKKPRFNASCILWTSGIKSWKASCRSGYWIHGSSDSMGESDIESLFSLIQRKNKIIKLTFQNNKNENSNDINTYELKNPIFPNDIENREEFYWMSSFAYEAAINKFPSIKNKKHACGMGNTYDKLLSLINNKTNLTCYLDYKSWKKNLK